ncbi:MAG: response regulator [Candidatus Saganbacteria bacterium]|nr:response regulator [Candidatus Saganbacteria bacterium]
MSKKPLILVVDDEVDIAENIGELLKASEKYEVLTCNSAIDALQVIKKNRNLLGMANHIKLVLMDIKMPEMSGLELLAKIREEYSHSQVGVIMLTAWADTEKWNKAREGGAAGYIKKPFREKELIGTVDRFFSGKEDWMVEQTKWELLANETKLKVDEKISSDKPKQPH